MSNLHDDGESSDHTEAQGAERLLTHLTFTSTAYEAESLAAHLRKLGIVAVAKAERSGRSAHTTSVAVLESDLDRALEALDARIQSEGDACNEEIAREMLAEEECIDAEIDPDGTLEWEEYERRRALLPNPLDDEAEKVRRRDNRVFLIFVIVFATSVALLAWKLSSSSQTRPPATRSTPR